MVTYSPVVIEHGRLATTLTSPTLSDSADNVGAGRVGIWCRIDAWTTGTADTVAFNDYDGNTVSVTFAAAGEKIDFAFKRVRSTGTNVAAANIQIGTIKDIG